MKKLSLSFIIIVFLSIGIYYTTTKKTHASNPANQTLAGQTIAFTLPNIDGSTFDLSEHKGKKIILNFWATWCPPCIAEIPHLVELQNKREDILIVGIALDTDQTKVPPFVAKKNINYPTLYGNSEITEYFGGISSIPETIIMNEKHEIINRVIGYHSLKEFENLIK